MRRAQAVLVSMCVLLSACGKKNSGPTAPTPTQPLPQVVTAVSPSPVVATVKSVDAANGRVTFRAQATVQFQETAGTGGHITKVLSVITRTAGGDSPSEVVVDLPFAARGSVSGAYFHEFDVTQPADVRWRLSGTGVDDQGRTFTTQIADVDIVSAASSSGPIAPSANRWELWGGPNYSQYLGCFTCNQFVTDSVFNEFGSYGSRFSTTSIWNAYSSFGGPYSNYSPCNPYTSTPPRLIDANARVYVELTLNRFRPAAWLDAIPWLQTTVCQ